MSTKETMSSELHIYSQPQVATATCPPTTINTSFGHSLSTLSTVKLDDKNYALWKGMVLAILRGQKMEGYVLGTKPQPSAFNASIEKAGTSETTINPEREKWCAIDQALLGWLLGSMTVSIACHVIDLSTSREV